MWDSGSVDQLSGLDDAPLVPLDIVAEHRQDSEDAQTLDGHLLPHVVLGAGGPGQEGAHVLGQLGLRGGRAVLVLDNLVVERRIHADSSAGVVRVEALAVLQLYSRRGVTVPIQKMVDIVLVTVPVNIDRS